MNQIERHYRRLWCVLKRFIFKEQLCGVFGRITIEKYGAVGDSCGELRSTTYIVGFNIGKNKAKKYNEIFKGLTTETIKGAIFVYIGSFLGVKYLKFSVLRGDTRYPGTRLDEDIRIPNLW